MEHSAESGETTVVLNPVSGSGDHADAVRDRALLEGYRLVETEDAGDAADLAAAAARRGAPLVAAAGGDGTLNEVIRGVDAADALGDVEIGVIPVGTGNNFAGNVGIAGIDEAFTVLAEGERRRIDLGMAAGQPFVNSCIAGLTADASGETDPELKSKYGVVAYVINTLQSVAEFDGLRIEVDVWTDSESDPVWTGDALCVLVGNGRRFSIRGESQANMEDGRFDVAIVENVPAAELVQEALAERLFGSESVSTVRMRAAEIDIRSLDDGRVNFSLDGEMVRDDGIRLQVRDRAVTVAVGETYEPSPAGDDA